MALPPLMPPITLNSRRPRSQGVTRPTSQVIEPGQFYDDALNDVLTAHFPEVTQVTDYEITGTFASSATWTIVITPLTTRSGTAAAAQAMEPVSISYTATAQSAADTVTGIIAAINTSATGLTPAVLATWTRVRGYITASAGATTAKVRLTARAGITFSAVITSTLAGDSYTATAIASPVTSTMKVGLYVALDTTKGTSGYDANGKPYITAVTSSIAAANIIGPVFLGDGTKPVERGYAYREYETGNIPLAKYGHVTAYGEKAIALASGPEVVYVRHTTSGDYLAGMATDAAGAAAGATANLWTGTPTAVDSTAYAFNVSVVNNLGVTVTELVTFSSGAGTTATLIVTGLKAALLAKPTLTGLVAGAGTTTLTLTGPADGRAVTVADVGPGVLTFVETTPEVSTHTRLTRGDKFVAPSTRIGSVRTAVPVQPLV
jgi:hypothetical protein